MNNLINYKSFHFKDKINYQKKFIYQILVNSFQMMERLLKLKKKMNVKKLNHKKD